MQDARQGVCTTVSRTTCEPAVNRNHFAFQSVSDELNAAPIQHIGKLLVLWRPQPEKERTVDENRMPGPKDVKVLKYSKRGGQRPEIKTLRVLGNQRLTPGGQIKRAKPKQKSIKKRQAD